MSSDKTSQKYETLLSEGPKTAEALNGHPSVDERRIYDIQKFNPKDMTTALWYLEDHDTEQVLRKWLELNEDALQANNVGKRSLSYTLTNEWMDAWREINDDPELDWLGEGGSNSGGQRGDHGEQTCPKCGKSDVKNLPRHLRGCDGGEDDG